MLQDKSCINTPLFQSYSLKQVGSLNLRFDIENRRCLLFVKATSIEIKMLDMNAVIQCFSLQFLKSIERVAVIPTKLPRSDLLFVLFTSGESQVVEISQARQYRVVARHLGKLRGQAEQIHCDIDYVFNVMDTDGFIMYSMDNSITILNFCLNKSGFTLTRTSNFKFQYENISYIGFVRRLFYKSSNHEPSLGVIHQVDGKTQLNILSGSNQPSDRMTISKANIRHFYCGQELVVLTNSQIIMYNYNSSKPIRVHNLPYSQCVTQILHLEEVYCAVGDILMLFNREGTKQYGKINCRSAVHVGQNTILTEHLDEDCLLLEVSDLGMTELGRWVNLGNIFFVDCINNNGMETFVTVSPNRQKQLTLLTKSQVVIPLCHEELDETIIDMSKIVYKNKNYLFLNKSDQTLVLLRVQHDCLVELWRAQFRFITVYNNYIVLSTGIYKMDYEHTVLAAIHETAIQKAIGVNNCIVYSDGCEIRRFGPQSGKAQLLLAVSNPISLLLCSKNQIYYSQWKVGEGSITSIQNKQIVYQGEKSIRSAVFLQKFLILGFNHGVIEIVDVEQGSFRQTFNCGQLPVKIYMIDFDVYCLSNHTIRLSVNNGTLVKRMISLKNLSALVGLSSDIVVVSSSKELAIYQYKQSEQTNSHSLRVCGNDEVPMVCCFNNQVYVWKPYELLIVDPTTYETTTHQHQFSSISAVTKCQLGIMVAGSSHKTKMVSYFVDGKEFLRYQLKKQPLNMSFMSDGKVIISLDNQIKVFRLDESAKQLSDIMMCSMSMRCCHLSIRSQMNKIVVGDPYKQIILYDYEFGKTNRLTCIAKFVSPRLFNSVMFLGQLIIVVDKIGNMMALLPNFQSQNDLDKIKLTISGGINIGQEIWTLREESEKSILYGTARGTIGRISLLDSQQEKILRPIEKEAFLQLHRVGTHDSAPNNLDIGRYEAPPSWLNCVLDGSLLPHAEELLKNSEHALKGTSFQNDQKNV